MTTYHCELKDVIKIKGFPVYTKSGKVSKKYLKAHRKANKVALDKYGVKTANAITKLIKKIPKEEWLGCHNRQGKIFISKKVPKKFRPAVRLHEETEHTYIIK